MPILSSIIEKDIAIDLGTDTTILYVAGIGIRLREPTVVTIDRTTGRVLKVGEDARKMLGRTPGNLVPKVLQSSRFLILDLLLFI